MENITALLIYNHSLYTEAYQRLLDLYHLAAATVGINLRQCSNHSLHPAVVNGEFTLSIHLKPYDFCIFLDKDVLLAQQIEEMGVPVFNSPQSIGLCDNKIAMTQRFAQENLPICDTFFSTTQFFPILETDFHTTLEKRLGFPLVVKEAYGSYGEQVYLAESQEDLITIRNKIQQKPHLYQRYVASSRGIDLRVYVCGEKIIGSMKRENKGDFRANLSIGGTITPHTLTESEQNLALSANRAMGTLFSGVDILWDEKGNPLLCEANASAHIKHYYDFSGENLAISILKEIKSRL